VDTILLIASNIKIEIKLGMVQFIKIKMKIAMQIIFSINQVLWCKWYWGKSEPPHKCEVREHSTHNFVTVWFKAYKEQTSILQNRAL